MTSLPFDCARGAALRFCAMLPPPGFRGVFRSDASARAVYSESAGVLRVVPLAVAVPADAEDVVRLLVWAAERGTPVVPRGSGSSMSGAAVGDGVVLDLSRLRHGPAADASWQLVRCGPGVTRGAVERAARAHGLRFPVDPSSGAFCTVGGMAATNAAGARSLRYGATRHWVIGLDCVFADGSRAWVRRDGVLPRAVAPLARFARAAASMRERARAIAVPAVRKNSSGYALDAFAESGDLVDLLVGSEGTLAVFVGLELALAEAPARTASLLAAWPTLAHAVRGAELAREAGASACELLDRTFLDLAKEGGRVPVGGDYEAVLLIELESEARGGGTGAPRAGTRSVTVDDAAGESGDSGAPTRPPSDAAPNADGATRRDGIAARADALARAFRLAGASAVEVGLDPAAEESLWSLRHAVSPILSRLDASIASMQIIEDGVVPPARLADYVAGVRAALARAGVPGVIFGHAGDANVHVNPLVDVSRAGWRDRVDRLLDEVVTLTATLGGTLAGEHGDGRLRTPLLDRVWSADAIDLFREVKAIFDPSGILNPGVKVPVADGRALGDIKYDPALAALPGDARRVLERVSRERAYDRPRLEMLDEPV
jgi:FAD/FMN-containing dehydrogenase